MIPLVRKLIFIGMVLMTVNWMCRLDRWQKRNKFFYNSQCLRAAVLEHVPQGHRRHNTPREIIDMNLEIYGKAIRMASWEGAQLLVLPEDSLINAEDYNRSTLISLLEPMPDTSQGEIINFCTSDNNNDDNFIVLKKISCWAMEYKIFIALSFGNKVKCDIQTDVDCPKDGHYLHNAIALFDWNGFLVARYHKMQLFFEFHYDIPRKKYSHREVIAQHHFIDDDYDDDRIVYFDSPFGRLGFLICFDILFKLPGVELVTKYHVNTILYSTYWYNYLPFINSIQMQQAFAMTHNINFLAASAQVPKYGTTGSGIFMGKQGALAYTIGSNGLSKLIIGTIPTNAESDKTLQKCTSDVKTLVVFKNKTKQILKQNHMDLSDLKKKPLNLIGEKSYAWCSSDSKICCRVYYSLEKNDFLDTLNEKFVFLAGNSTVEALGSKRYPLQQEFCAIVACQDQNCHKFSTSTRLKFRSIYMSATFNSRYVYPSVVTNELHLLPTTQWTFTRLELSESILLVKPNEPVIAVTLYGRKYDHDPPYRQ